MDSIPDRDRDGAWLRPARVRAGARAPHERSAVTRLFAAALDDDSGAYERLRQAAIAGDRHAEQAFEALSLIAYEADYREAVQRSRELDAATGTASGAPPRRRAGSSSAPCQPPTGPGPS